MINTSAILGFRATTQAETSSSGLPIIDFSKSRTGEVHKLSTFRSPLLRLNLVSGYVQQCCKLDFGDAPELVKVETFTVAEVTAVVIHWVGDWTGAFEELGGRETVLMEWLVI